MNIVKNKNFEVEINGLRGIAIALVVLFHFEIYPFSGGFVGVDIFFVISGYLISLIILKDIKSTKLIKKITLKKNLFLLDEIELIVILINQCVNFLLPKMIKFL